MYIEVALKSFHIKQSRRQTVDVPNYSAVLNQMAVRFRNGVGSVKTIIIIT